MSPLWVCGRPEWERDATAPAAAPQARSAGRAAGPREDVAVARGAADDGLAHEPLRLAGVAAADRRGDGAVLGDVAAELLPHVLALAQVGPEPQRVGPGEEVLPRALDEIE